MNVFLLIPVAAWLWQQEVTMRNQSLLLVMIIGIIASQFQNVAFTKLSGYSPIAGFVPGPEARPRTPLETTGNTTNDSEKWPLINAVTVLSLLALSVLLLSLRQSHGHLVYALDDPCIHMGMAENPG